VQESVRREIWAISDTVKQCKADRHTVCGSAALVAEIGAISNKNKYRHVWNFYINTVNEEAMPSDNVDRRASALLTQGLKKFDPYHVAFAETSGVDYLLTTDAEFERRASALKLAVRVINPVTFIQEGFL
jgi:predicted nucleic acid-binding protein